MNVEQARKLKKGDRVYWDNDKDDQGTVMFADDYTVSIKWDKPVKGANYLNIADLCTRDAGPIDKL